MSFPSNEKKQYFIPAANYDSYPLKFLEEDSKELRLIPAPTAEYPPFQEVSEREEKRVLHHYERNALKIDKAAYKGNGFEVLKIFTAIVLGSATFITDRIGLTNLDLNSRGVLLAMIFVFTHFLFESIKKNQPDETIKETFIRNKNEMFKLITYQRLSLL